MRARLSLNALRPCPNATPGPSSRPANRVVRYNASHQVRYESTVKPKTSPVFTSPNTATSAYPHPAFDQLSTSLSSWLPCFGARGDEVRLLNSPGGFYQDVIEMLKRAKRRILISTLYIGTEETELVSSLRMLGLMKGRNDTESTTGKSTPQDNFHFGLSSIYSSLSSASSGSF